jgi:hypothetical protein
MKQDLSKTLVAVVAVMLLLISVMGTWVSLSSSTQYVQESGPQSATISVMIANLFGLSTGHDVANVQLNVIKGG